MKNKPEAVETEAEELLFYSDKERDAALGTIGHLRIDFGRSGEEFNCTWFDHANSGENDSYFKESFDIFIDDLRTGVLKSRAEMRKFCYGKDECRNSHSYTEDCWGFRVLSDRYAYYIRCTPGAGDYECYIYAYDKIHLMEFLAKEKKLPEHCYSRLASTGEPILIRYAEKGYYPITLPEGSTVEGMNESIGVSEAQRMAMEAGSMFGWRVPGADPRNYEAKEQSKMKIAIYQINSDRDSERIAFVGLNSMERRRGSKDICPEIYDKVYEAEVGCMSLEEVYEKFNIDKPDDYKARTLSVSDVVEVIESDSVEPGFYFCDSIGFEKIDFDPDKAEVVKNETIRVLIVEPEKKPYVKEIDSGVESLQREVDGDIKATYPSEIDPVAYICNEESKLEGLPLNRAIRNDDGEIIDIVAGTFIVVGLGESNFCSLNEAMLKKYMEKLKNPEMILRVNGKIHVLPIPEAPKPIEKHGEER